MDAVGSTNPIVVGETPSIVRPDTDVVVDDALIDVDPKVNGNPEPPVPVQN